MTDIPIFSYKCGFCGQKFNDQYYEYMSHIKDRQDNRLNMLLGKKTTTVLATNQKDSMEIAN